MRKPLLIPDSLLIDAVMAQMQRTRNNVAIVVDEYGGTAGMVALEDLVEEIIGEFQDEFDAENPPFRLQGDRQLWVRGDVQLDLLRDRLALEIHSGAVDTVGGFVASLLGRIPSVGDRVETDGVTIRVEKMEQHRVAEVSLTLPTDRVDALARWRDD
jgi:CBS domain containing-hemolysin-like protein